MADADQLPVVGPGDLHRIEASGNNAALFALEVDHAVDLRGIPDRPALVQLRLVVVALAEDFGDLADF